MKSVVKLLPAASLLQVAEPENQDDAEEKEQPQKMPPPTVFTAKFDEIEKMAGEDGSMADLTAAVDKLAIEEEPGLKNTVVDLTKSPTPAPPPGTGVPGDHAVCLSPSSIDSSSSSSYSDGELPSADPAAPAAVEAVAAAKRAKVSMANITEGREDVHRMEQID